MTNFIFYFFLSFPKLIALSLYCLNNQKTRKKTNSLQQSSGGMLNRTVSVVYNVNSFVSYKKLIVKIFQRENKTKNDSFPCKS